MATLSAPLFISLRLVVLAASAVAFLAPAFATDLGWKTWRDSEYDFTVDVPTALFPVERDGPLGGTELRSEDGSLSLLINGQMNGDELPMGTLLDIFIENSGEKTVTYKRTKNNWLVVSGLQSEDDGTQTIYYIRAETTPDRSRLSSFTIYYPKSRKAEFDAIVTRMSRSLTPPQ